MKTSSLKTAMSDALTALLENLAGAAWTETEAATTTKVVKQGVKRIFDGKNNNKKIFSCRDKRKACSNECL